MDNTKNSIIRAAIRERYGDIASKGVPSEDCDSSNCCLETEATDRVNTNNEQSSQMGYSAEDFASVPEGSNMGLGCGDPQTIAALKPGEIVLDLGSGGGFDCFLAAKQVGATGKVIGVDMTLEMIAKARSNAEKSLYSNVEFRLGEIEQLPIADDNVNVIISNCVINLSADKPKVFREAYRVLKPGGRLAVSDVVATAEFPQYIRNDPAMHSICAAGSEFVDDLENMLADAGFTDIEIVPKDESSQFIREWAPEYELEQYIQSAVIKARKPTT